MGKRDINEVLAENLEHWMRERKVKQEALAKAAGVAQRTISNYLHPEKRELGANGKKASAKITEIQMIADALKVDTWELLREYGPGQREAYAAIESAFLQLLGKAKPATETPTTNNDRKAA